MGSGWLRTAIHLCACTDHAWGAGRQVAYMAWHQQVSTRLDTRLNGNRRLGMIVSEGEREQRKRAREDITLRCGFVCVAS
eukprot:scaffold5651_cov108-Isochrysis_galbana.AAC.4